MKYLFYLMLVLVLLMVMGLISPVKVQNVGMAILNHSIIILGAIFSMLADIFHALVGA